MHDPNAIQEGVRRYLQEQEQRNKQAWVTVRDFLAEKGLVGETKETAPTGVAPDYETTWSQIDRWLRTQGTTLSALREQISLKKTQDIVAEREARQMCERALKSLSLPARRRVLNFLNRRFG